MMPSRISLQISNNDDGTLSLIIDTGNEESLVRVDRNYRITFTKTRTLEQSEEIGATLIHCPSCGRTITKDGSFPKTKKASK